MFGYVRCEARGLLGGDQPLRRPGDVTVWNYRDGKATTFDVVITSPTAGVSVIKAAEEGGSAADRAEKAKCAQYMKIFAEEGVLFSPLAFKTRGGFGEQATKHLTNICFKVAQRFNRRPSQEHTFVSASPLYCNVPMRVCG